VLRFLYIIYHTVVVLCTAKKIQNYSFVINKVLNSVCSAAIAVAIAVAVPRCYCYKVADLR
jgi:hypothetical protein